MAEAGPGPRVLIAEDSPTQAALLREVLEAERFRVSLARNGRVAAGLFAREPFDIVLSDIVMPELDGLGLCRAIRASPDGGEVPVILLTAMTDPLDIARGLEAGADDFIRKPYDPDELVVKVRAVLVPTGERRGKTDDRSRMVRLLIGAFEATARQGVLLESRNGELAAAKSVIEGDAVRLRMELGNILDAAAEGIVGLDRNGLMTFVNPSATATLGWGGEAMTGRAAHQTFMHSRADGTPIPPEDSPVFAVLAGHRSSHRAEGVFWTRDGVAVPVEHSCTPMRDRGDVIVGAVLVFRDITDRKREQAEREQLEEEFRQAHKMEAVGRLAGGVAHDFNNLLTVIIGFSELIIAGTTADEVTRRHIGQIQTAAQHAASLTRQLLAFSRRQVLHPCPISLGDTVTGLEQILRQLAGSKRELMLALDPAAGAVMADPGQVGQILVNLVINAADAMPGGGRIGIEVAEGNPAGDPDVSPAPPPGRYIRLSVRDTGTGMSPETRARIFEPFFTTKPPGAGTGLGLSTVYGIVQQSGGLLAVHTAPGRGATFTIYLPRLAEPVPALAAPVLPASPVEAPVTPGSPVAPGWSGAGGTLLVVESKPEIRDLLREVLTAGGYRVEIVGTSAEAVQLCRGRGIAADLLLVNLLLPDMSGPDLAATLQAGLPDLRVLLMSGKMTAGGGPHPPLLHGHEFLEKPFTPEALLKSVAAALRFEAHPSQPEPIVASGPGPNPVREPGIMGNRIRG